MRELPPPGWARDPDGTNPTELRAKVAALAAEIQGLERTLDMRQGHIEELQERLRLTAVGRDQAIARALALEETASKLPLLTAIAAAANELLDEDRESWSDYHTALANALAAYEQSSDVSDG